MVNPRTIAAGIPVLQGGEDVNGLNPHSRMPGEARTLYEYAERSDPRSHSLIVSFLARGRAHELIAEMDVEPRKPHP